jgi:hypothetical protein
LRAVHTIYFDRRPGIGLLLLRVAVGAALGSYALSGAVLDATALSFTVILGGIELIASPCLLLGFISPVTTLISFADFAVLVHTGRGSCCGLGMNAIAVSAVALVVGAGLAMIGPGAYSLDALLFGRREVIVNTLPGSRRE